VNCEGIVAPVLGLSLKRKRRSIWCFDFPTSPISTSPTIYWVFITLSQGYYHCDSSSSFLRRLLKLTDTRRTPQRWQNVGRCVGLALIGQARKTNLYLRFVLFVALFGVKKWCLVSKGFRVLSRFMRNTKNIPKWERELTVY